MQAITTAQAFLPVMHTNHACHRSIKLRNMLRFCKGIALLPAAMYAGIVVAAYLALSAISKVFHAKTRAHLFRYKARKFMVMHVLHKLDYLNVAQAPFTVLSYAKNLVKREVVANEEDSKLINRMLCLAPDALPFRSRKRGMGSSSHPFKSNYNKTHQ